MVGRFRRWLVPLFVLAYPVANVGPAAADHGGHEQVTVDYSWSPPADIVVHSPVEFRIAPGDGEVTHEDLRSQWVLDRVGQISLGLYVQAGTTTPTVPDDGCADGQGTEFAVGGVDVTAHSEAGFRRDDGVTLSPGRVEDETELGGARLSPPCRSTGDGEAPDDGEGTDGEPDDSNSPECREVPRSQRAEDRGAPCPPTRQDHTSRDDRPEG